MPRVCTICTHPQRKAINKAIMDRTKSMRGIAAQYGLSKGTVGRHKEHMNQTLEDVATDERVVEARDTAVEVMKERLGEIPEVLSMVLEKWTMLDGKLDALLDEVENGPQFSEDAMAAIRAAEAGDSKGATVLVAQLRDAFTVAVRNRLATLREIRLLANDRRQAWQDIAELVRGATDNTVRVDYQVVPYGTDLSSD